MSELCLIESHTYALVPHFHISSRTQVWTLFPLHYYYWTTSKQSHEHINQTNNNKNTAHIHILHSVL